MEKIHIELKKDQNIWFTSDLHLNHSNVIRFCERPFQSTKEMNLALMNNWNNTVKEDDYIFMLGDFDWFPHRHHMRTTVSKLNGHKYFVLGNHDNFQSFELCQDLDLHICQDITVLYVTAEDWEQRNWSRKILEIILCHYPLMTWSHSNSDTYMLFGHIHSRENGILGEFNKELPIIEGKMMDVGVDRHGYKPITLEQAIKECKEYKKRES